MYTVQNDRIFNALGTSFSYVGIKNNPNKVRSFEGVDICWVEEANKVSKNSWGILLPTIRKKGSKIIITFNPELETDYTYVRFVKELRASAKEVRNGDGDLLWLETDDTIICKMTYKDNPWFFSDTELAGDMEKDKARDIDHFLNVWEGHTIQALEGAVYAKELRKVQEEGRICTVPYNNEIPVNLYFDLGRADYTCIWFIQRVAMQYRVLRYLAKNGEDITWFIKELKSLPYVYDRIFLPHDGKHKKLVFKHSIKEIVQNAFPNCDVVVVEKSPIVDGINATRMVMASCYFDEELTEEGVEALRHYRYKIVNGQISNEPLHDWASDGADAFRTFAMSRESSRPRGLGTKLKAKVNQFLDSNPGLGWMG
jgi:phage terminase large subunit